MKQEEEERRKRKKKKVPLQVDNSILMLNGRARKYLRDYQLEGVRWMCQKYVERSGCILGDDMGMGKTVQVVCFLNCIFHKKGTYQDVKMIHYRHDQAHHPHDSSSSSSSSSR